MKKTQTIAKPWPFALPDDGWFHLAPRGEFSGTDDLTGNPVTQVLDNAAFNSIVADFKQQSAADNFSGILIDYDHFSKFADKSTVAAGWITELQIREDGLWFRCRWSDTGESNLKSGCYRFISPVFGGEYITKDKARPVKLLRAGLTNDPNFKTLRPLSNRAGTVQEPEKKESPMKQLLAAIGLSPDASEEAAVAAIAPMKAAVTDLVAMTNRATAAEDKLKTMETAKLKADADAFCDAHEALIENRDAVHGQFLKDPEGTKALFGSMKAAPQADAEHATLHNRAKGQPGAEQAPAAKSNADELEDKVQSYMASNRCKYGQAFDAVSRANPELLKPKTKTED